MAAIYILIAGNVILSLVVWLTLNKERKRNRVLQAFVAGIVRSISDYVSKTDAIDLDKMPERAATLPVPYKNILAAVEHELLKNVLRKSPPAYIKWLASNRSLFQGKTSRNDVVDDGFVFMNYDLFDGLIARWRSPELMTPNEKAYLSEEIVVTNDNVRELQGEIAIYKDLLSGQVHSKNLRRETIDDQLAIMFSHLKQQYRDELKQQILAKN